MKIVFLRKWVSKMAAYGWSKGPETEVCSYLEAYVAKLVKGKPESKNLGCEVNLVANRIFNYPPSLIRAQSEFGAGWIINHLAPIIDETPRTFGLCREHSFWTLKYS